jgi:hypothetical protein
LKDVPLPLQGGKPVALFETAKLGKLLFPLPKKENLSIILLKIAGYDYTLHLKR